MKSKRRCLILGLIVLLVSCRKAPNDKKSIEKMMNSPLPSSMVPGKTLQEQAGVVSKHPTEHGQLQNSVAEVAALGGVNPEYKMVNALFPLYQDEHRGLFFQTGLNRKYDVNTFNLGLGQRHFFDGWTFGYNAFYDVSGSHLEYQRLSAGIELWKNYLHLSANGYYGLTGYHASDGFSHRYKKVANGYDLQAQWWLPNNPQFSARVKFEQYFGSDIVLLHKGSKGKDLLASSLGASYTPVPLLSFNVDHSRDSKGQSDTQLGLSVRYRIGIPILSQLDPRSVGAQGLLTEEINHIVERNNAITMKFMEKKHTQPIQKYVEDNDLSAQQKDEREAPASQIPPQAQTPAPPPQTSGTPAPSETPPQTSQTPAPPPPPPQTSQTPAPPPPPPPQTSQTPAPPPQTSGTPAPSETPPQTSETPPQTSQTPAPPPPPPQTSQTPAPPPPPPPQTPAPPPPPPPQTPAPPPPPPPQTSQTPAPAEKGPKQDEANRSNLLKQIKDGVPLKKVDKETVDKKTVDNELAEALKKRVAAIHVSSDESSDESSDAEWR